MPEVATAVAIRQCKPPGRWRSPRAPRAKSQSGFIANRIILPLVPKAPPSLSPDPNLPLHYKKHQKTMASRTEVSPGRRKNTVSEQISALGAMFTRVLSSGEPADASTTPTTTTRGRDRHPAGAEGGDDDGRSQGELLQS